MKNREKGVTRTLFTPRILQSPRQCGSNGGGDLIIGVISPAEGVILRQAVRKTWAKWSGDDLSWRQSEPKISRKMERFLRRKFNKTTKSTNEENPHSYSVRVLFMLNRSRDPDTMLRVEEEACIFQDLIVSDNPEGYSNLPLKTLSVMNFYLENCRGSRFLLKTDDDVFVRKESL